MKLGIIAPVEEESFQKASELGLDFVEFCINGSDHGENLHKYQNNLPHWIEKYHVNVGSIGRWKTEIQLSDGTIDPAEIEIAKDLMKISSNLHCPNYICGCNYVSTLSKFSNYQTAISFFETILAAAPSDVKVSVYNCRKGNFINNEAAWELVLGHLPELGIKYDPSHSIYAGDDYLQELMTWGDRINHVHLKGSLQVNGIRVDDPPAGLDGTNWKAILAILRAKKYNGNLSIEPHSDFWRDDLWEAGVKYTIRYFKNLLV